MVVKVGAGVGVRVLPHAFNKSVIKSSVIESTMGSKGLRMFDLILSICPTIIAHLPNKRLFVFAVFQGAVVEGQGR